jgi:Zn-dependent protease
MTDFPIDELLVWYLVFVFSTTLHEAAHALIAYLGGDSTAYEGGQVTLDPVPHIRREPMGMVVVPLLSFVMAGWMLGWASAPYNPYWGARYPRRRALMSLAGPVANLLLAFIAFAVAWALIGAGVLQFTLQGSWAKLFAVVGQDGYASPLGAFAMVLSVMLTLNVLLGVFNLLPVPPLDGASAIGLILPDRLAFRLRMAFMAPAWGFVGILIAWYAIRYLFRPVLGVAIQLLYPEFGYG